MAFYNKSKKKNYLLFLILNCLILNSFCQDTSKKRMNFSIRAELWGTQIFEPLNAPVRMPENIRYRRSNSINAPSAFYTSTDNPLKHGAYYGCIKTITSFSPAIKVKVDIYGEHRGVSYGAFNTKNIIVYPVIYVEGKDSFFLFKEKVIIDGKAGHFLDERLEEGLLIYNIDAQGIQANLTKGKWKFSYSLYGDFYNGIGLNIDDLHAVTIKRTFRANANTVLGGSLNAIAPPYLKKSNNLVWTSFGSHTIKRGAIYAQIGYRNRNKENLNFKKGLTAQTGFVIGGKVRYEFKQFSFNNQTEFRFYGESFNANHFSNELRYRQPLNIQPLYANTIGNYLFPLRKSDTPFSQWPVFTEYQGLNVAAISFVGNVKYQISPKTEINLEYDINQIIAGRDTAYMNRTANNFLYPFFTFGFFYTPVKSIKAGLIATNKGMNLDISYPTFYLYKTPYLGIKMSMLFE